MPLRTQAICDLCGHEESFGAKQSFPETPPPDWFGMKLTRRNGESYEFSWGLLCHGCYEKLTQWLRAFKPFSDPQPAPASTHDHAASEPSSLPAGGSTAPPGGASTPDAPSAPGAAA